MTFSIGFKNKIIDLVRQVLAKYNPEHILEKNDCSFLSSGEIEIYLPRNSYVEALSGKCEFAKLIKAESELRNGFVSFFEKPPIMIRECKIGEIVKLWRPEATLILRNSNSTFNLSKDIYPLGIVYNIITNENGNKVYYVRKFKFLIENFIGYYKPTDYNTYFYLEPEYEQSDILEIIPKEKFTEEILKYYDYCCYSLIQRINKNKENLALDSKEFIKNIEKDFIISEHSLIKMKIKEDVYRDYLPET